MSSRADVSIMDGVESPYQTPEQQRRAKTLVPPAAKWILLAGEKTYGLRKNGRAQQGRGYSLCRWSLWKRDFAEIATNNGLTDDVKHVASQAALKMEKIEG